MTARDEDDLGSALTDPKPLQPVSDADRWRFVQAEPWATTLRQVPCKIGPGTWPTWKALVDRHGIDAVVTAARKAKATERWPDAVAQVLEAQGEAKPASRFTGHTVEVL